MAIVTHGSDLSLAPTITPIVRETGGSVRGALDRLARQGFPAVQLDATLRGIRPRELDRQARRELQAIARRRNLRISGLDLFIPRRHYIEADHMDRAMSATHAAIELAADLGKVPISLSLPTKRLAPELAEAIVEAADGHGVRVAVHDEDQLDALEQWVKAIDQPMLGAALDPAALLTRGYDPAEVAGRFGERLAVARLSDVERGLSGDDLEQGARGESVRCRLGRGELDLMRWRVMVDLASRRTGPVVLDLRGLTDPMGAAVEGKRAWENAAMSL